VYCTECGTSLSVSAKFCSSCGSRISTSEQEQIQTEVREHREVLTSTQQNNDGLGKIVLIVVAFFCLYEIFIPGDLGISMFASATSNCSSTLVSYQHCSVRDNNQSSVTILGFISLACFSIALLMHKMDYTGNPGTIRPSNQPGKRKPKSPTKPKPPTHDGCLGVTNGRPCRVKLPLVLDNGYCKTHQNQVKGPAEMREYTE